MKLSLVTIAVAHFVSFLLATLDVVARGWRYALLVRGVNGSLSFRGALVLTLFGDAAAALTPLRLGGEPARIVGARRDGVSVPRAILALALENALTYLILIPVAAIIAARYGKDWWSTVAPHVDLSLVRWFAVSLLLILALWVMYALWRRRGRQSEKQTAVTAGFRRALADLISFPLPLLLLCCLLSAISLVARVSIFPVLVFSMPHPPSLGVATFASLGLLYGQLAIPTPAGAGPIDAAVLAGAAGVSSKAIDILASWRLYTTILPTAAGLTVGAVVYGRSVFSSLLRSLSRGSIDDKST